MDSDFLSFEDGDIIVGSCGVSGSGEINDSQFLMFVTFIFFIIIVAGLMFAYSVDGPLNINKPFKKVWNDAWN